MKNYYAVYIKLTTGVVLHIQLATQKLIDLYPAVARVKRYYEASVQGREMHVKHSVFGPGTHEQNAARNITAALTMSIDEGIVLKNKVQVLVGVEDTDPPNVGEFRLLKMPNEDYETPLLKEKAIFGICLIDASSSKGLEVDFIHGPNGRCVTGAGCMAYLGYNANAWRTTFAEDDLLVTEVQDLKSLSNYIDGERAGEENHRDLNLSAFFNFKETEDAFMRDYAEMQKAV